MCVESEVTLSVTPQEPSTEFSETGVSHWPLDLLVSLGDLPVLPLQPEFSVWVLVSEHRPSCSCA